MLLQLPHVLNVGERTRPSRGVELSFDGDGSQPEPTHVCCPSLCLRPEP